jgi:DNA-binding response OmpR family regulator
MSGYSDGMALERARIGAELAFLPKPFSTDELAAKIQEVRRKLSRFAAKASSAN